MAVPRTLKVVSLVMWSAVLMPVSVEISLIVSVAAGEPPACDPPPEEPPAPAAAPEPMAAAAKNCGMKAGKAMRKSALSPDSACSSVTVSGAPAGAGGRLAGTSSPRPAGATCAAGSSSESGDPAMGPSVRGVTAVGVTSPFAAGAAACSPPTKISETSPVLTTSVGAVSCAA
ncbi:hypothetical protein [Ramlibacter albus]|uniref:Uncharacterized protein n=1 Tax=Ramlibacter albus TaxID=2079448 RepID=A0A923ME37_9BURK|nr:hypothetical protein [Ramlibacter albus]MBC5768436.1 hypothetical protein [Ramlibacter albus]